PCLSPFKLSLSDHLLTWNGITYWNWYFFIAKVRFCAALLTSLFCGSVQKAKISYYQFLSVA
ncbi:hypothetical protein ACFSZP_05140, partial [Paraglaciecola agarilytica]